MSRRLPEPLKTRLGKLARPPHSFLPLPAFAEADKPSQLFQYYLLDTNNFQPNVFTVDRSRHQRPCHPHRSERGQRSTATFGAVRVVLEPKPGLPTDPNDIEAFIDIFTDISGLFVINNESGWYEGWMIHDLVVPQVAAPRPGRPCAVRHDDRGGCRGHRRDRRRITTCPGKRFTLDGKDVRLPNAHDHFPDRQTNLVPISLSMGAYNCLQQSDCHSYWEFNEYTDWVFPLYELPFTGGVPGTFDDGHAVRPAIADSRLGPARCLQQ